MLTNGARIELPRKSIHLQSSVVLDESMNSAIRGCCGDGQTSHLKEGVLRAAIGRSVMA